MGYDMYRVKEKPDSTQEDPELEVVDGEGNYFRLNIWGMARAKLLAVWGISTLTVDDLIKHHWEMEEANKIKGSERILAHMIATSKFGARCYGSNEEAKKVVEGTESFGSNFNYASVEECEVFAEAISRAFDKLDASLIKPDYDYEYFREFSEWLFKSDNGIYVG